MNVKRGSRAGRRYRESQRAYSRHRPARSPPDECSVWCGACRRKVPSKTACTTKVNVYQEVRTRSLRVRCWGQEVEVEVEVRVEVEVGGSRSVPV